MTNAIRLAWLPRAGAFGLLWWVLAEGRLETWGLGIVAVAAATWASVRLWPPTLFRLNLAALPGFLAFFLVNSMRGGWQVAGMAWRGQAALRPALVELPIALPPGAPRLLITALLGLMPGTLGVELVADRLRLHVLHADLPVAAEARALEERILRLLEGA